MSRSSASSLRSGQGAAAVIRCWRKSITRARHWRSSLVHGNSVMPTCFSPRSTAAAKPRDQGRAYRTRPKAVLPAGIRVWRSPRPRDRPSGSPPIRESARQSVRSIIETNGRGQKYSRLALCAVELGCHDEFRLRERLRFGKARTAAIRQQIAAAIAAALRDPIRIGPRQQDSGGMVRIGRIPESRGRSLCHCRKCAAPASGREHPPNARGQVALVAAQHRNPEPQIGVARVWAGAQDVALAQDRGELAGEALGAECAP